MKMHIDHVQAELQRAGLHVSRRDLMRLAMAGGAAAALGAPFMTRREALAQEEPVVGGVWRMALTANPTAYPITAPGAIVDILVNKTMYNNLVKYQLTEGVIEVVPDLAESWEANADLTQYTFTLRSDVTWHDGEPLTADDVKFTFDSVLDPEVTARFSGPISSVESVEVVDPQTVVFNLKSSFAPLPVMLGYNQAIVPKHLLEGQDLNQPTEFLAAPVGSGPFKFGTAQQGSYLEVVANEDYFLGRPNLDRIIFQVITDGNARVAQLKSGDIDFTVIDPPQIDSVSNDANLKIVEAQQVNYYFLAFNHSVERLQNPAVRQALTLALNRQAIVDTVLKGYGQVATGPIHPTLGDYYNPDVTTYGYDQDRAKQLLAEAGWTAGDDGILVNEAGERFTILLNGPKGFPVLEQLLTYAQQEYTNLGIEVTLVDPSDVISLPSTVAQGDRQIPRELLSHIIHQRMDEIFNLVQQEITNAGYANRLSGGMVMTGGAAAVAGIAELAADVFGMGVRVGVPSENIGGLSDSVEAPRFATVVGLAIYGGNRAAGGNAGMIRRRQIGGAGLERVAGRFKTWFQDFF